MICLNTWKIARLPVIINEKHITAWFNDAVELNDSIRIPMSRAQKRKILAERKSKAV